MLYRCGCSAGGKINTGRKTTERIGFGILGMAPGKAQVLGLSIVGQILFAGDTHQVGGVEGTRKLVAFAVIGP
jgi:hypothetical protein